MNECLEDWWNRFAAICRNVLLCGNSVCGNLRMFELIPWFNCMLPLIGICFLFKYTAGQPHFSDLQTVRVTNSIQECNPVVTRGGPVVINLQMLFLEWIRS